MKVSMIGSFQRYYSEICSLITSLQACGHTILSPANSKIVNSVENFVIFDSDNKALTPHQIQTETLNKILKSDLVYVYCPNGYIGRTTCYEIGVLRTTTIPLFFSEMPQDLPIFVDNSSIINPESFPEWIDRWKNLGKRSFEYSELLDIAKTRYPAKRVVICGSMAFYYEMEEIKKSLEANGVPAIIPKEEDVSVQKLDADGFVAFKRKVSMQYLSKIRENTTFGVLIINNKKNGKENYIGTNTLVEISMAFCWGRPIFLYNDLYAPMRDELEAWNAICLQRDISKLIQVYRGSRYQMEDPFKSGNEIEGQLYFN